MASEQTDVKAGVVYMLMDAKTFDYAVCDVVNDHVKMEGISNVDETNPKHCW